MFEIIVETSRPPYTACGAAGSAVLRGPRPCHAAATSVVHPIADDTFGEPVFVRTAATLRAARERVRLGLARHQSMSPFVRGPAASDTRDHRRSLLARESHGGEHPSCGARIRRSARQAFKRSSVGGSGTRERESAPPPEAEGLGA
jgi:hypothetical protein